MYTFLLLALLAAAAGLIISGALRRSATRGIAGALVAAGTIFFFWLLGFWGEMLWFEAIGYANRFWTVFWAEALLAAGGALAGLVVPRLYAIGAPKGGTLGRVLPSLVGAAIGGLWGAANWDTVLLFWNRVSAGVQDPVLGRDVGFYFFTLPFLDAVWTLLFLLALIGLASVFARAFVRVRGGEITLRKKEDRAGSSGRGGDGEEARRLYSALYASAGVFLLILSAGAYLRRFHVMYSTWGVVTGPGWTDIHIRLPAFTIVAVLTALLAVSFLVPSLRSLPSRLPAGRGMSKPRYHLRAMASGAVIVLALWLVSLAIIPGLLQWLVVEPNEITYEKPYIAHNIEQTRRAFGLEDVEEREFPASEEFTSEIVEQNSLIFENIRLWDWRALTDVYKQFQEIRLYYEFADVDIDRYTIDGAYRQVMVSAREMELSNLPEQSQTFVNRRFKYTHGYGITMTTVSDFTPEGLPNLLIKDIPPVSRYAGLEVTRPQIYYGELTRSHVIANSGTEEFDYPTGEQNAYIKYPGSGGVRISNLWRKFLFGRKFDGTRLLLSSYATSDSRILFHRRVRERVHTVAPFLQLDDDPYIVLLDGRLYWIVDCYVTSRHYPYSERFSSTEVIDFKESNRTRELVVQAAGYLDGSNYVRNSVKAVVDAFDGTVDLYVFEPDDPIIRAWSKIFPGLFKPESSMPAGLRDHVRYPADILLVQGLVYAKYHMTDPTVFYNQEDLWIRATEKYYDEVQPVSPYYVIWKPPESDEPEFVIMLPFTPKNRQVLIGWIAGMCDGENYGRFLAYKFPKEKRVLGTQQVETKIDQDSYLSGQLSLWDQRGSNVIRGNVLAIPVAKTLIYVEPIYLQAETAAYPELRLVAVMHNDNLSYAETFDEALRGLLEAGAAAGRPVPRPSRELMVEELIQKAAEAFDLYLKLQSEKRFDEAASELKKLQQALEELSDRADLGEGPE